VKTFRRTVSGLLGFDRRERRGTYVLSLLLIILIVIRVIAFRPRKADPVRFDEDTLVTTTDATPLKVLPELFSFDPNSASHDDLLRLGLSERQASTLINYRNSGARFRCPEDIRRVYGIDSLTSMRLMPYVSIIHADVAVKSPVGEEHPVTGRPSKDELREKELLDINMCNAWELEQLPGIGPVLSLRIIRYRSLLGGFVSKSQLNEVYGLDSSVAVLISERVTLTCDSVIPLVLDSASFGDLARHPYLGYETARTITRYRTLTVAPLTLGAMVRDRVITAEQAERIAPYIMPSPLATGDDYEFISSKVLK
jgi:competence protein ComEA